MRRDPDTRRVPSGTLDPTASMTAPVRPSAGPSSAVTPGIGVSCPPAVFDPSASLGPVFAEDVFVHDESEGIARTGVAGLVRLYAGDPDADPCSVLTDHGLETAVVADPRLAAALRGQQTVRATPIFRQRLEHGYDLRALPPTVPLTVVFDLPAGATVTGLASGVATTTTDPERVGLGVTIVYDGHAWR
ncbi:MAG: hypothetical protein ABIR11_01345, partial [Candidatus Limnocylindrales bacterium]